MINKITLSQIATNQSDIEHPDEYYVPYSPP